MAASSTLDGHLASAPAVHGDVFANNARIRRSLTWAPTVGLSWLWGLGFFYVIHVTRTYGWLGFAAFAVPNALGLYLFGHVLGAPGRDPAAIFKVVGGRYLGLFMLAQVAAVGVTCFGIVVYVLRPMFGDHALAGTALVILLGAVGGHAASISTLRWLHTAYLGIGAGAALAVAAWLTLTGDGPSVPMAAFDERFYGLVLPSLVGFLLGPWSDVQQWQRAVAIHREGGSVRLAYGTGSLIFFALLLLNAWLAALSGGGALIVSADGLPGAQATVTGTVMQAASPLLTDAYLVWVVLALASTIDSAYCAVRWLLGTVTKTSESAVLALLPAGLVTSPIWMLAAAVACAAAVYAAGLSMMYLMVPFATLFVGGSLCLVCETLGGRPVYDGVLCAMIGTVAALIFVAGYLGPTAPYLALAPLIACVGALAGIETLLRRSPELQPTHSDAAAPLATVTVTREETVSSHGFDGPWFVLQLTPTYDDTNSVGNIYFANYVRWVGKARELFFHACMPDFDLSTTNFYVMTRSFTHDFRREAREFEPVIVRLRIAKYNRKFVILTHEIHSRTHGLLGRGEQSLMFVDTTGHRPLDIPPSIMAGFLPHYVPEPGNDRVRTDLTRAHRAAGA